MSAIPQTGPIVVYAATGFTGTLISIELARRGGDFTVAGRDEAKLERLADSLDTSPEIAAVGNDDATGLRDLFGGAGAVIACAGPFCKHGTPVVEAAAEAGANYLDTTGEQPFIASCFDRHDEAAKASGAALVSGMGFDYVPGDMLAALTAEGMGKLDELTVAYAVSGFTPTRGTALSAIDMVSDGGVEWVAGHHRPAPRNASRGHFPFPDPIGERRVGRYPAGEQIMVPRHIEVKQVRTLIDIKGLLGGLPTGPLGGPLMTAGGLLMDTPLATISRKIVSQLPEGPSEENREGVRYTLVCDVRGPDGRRRGVLRGSDIYGITAKTTTEGALRMASEGFTGSGALAPAEAFDPADFLDALKPAGISYELGPTS